MLYLDSHLTIKGLPGGSDGKESARNAGDWSSIPRSGRFPWRREWQPTPVVLPGKFHGQKSLAGYSPCGHKELDTAEKKEFFPITNHCAFYLKAGTHEFPDRFMLHILLHC